MDQGVIVRETDYWDVQPGDGWVYTNKPSGMTKFTEFALIISVTEVNNNHSTSPRIRICWLQLSKFQDFQDQDLIFHDVIMAKNHSWFVQKNKRNVHFVWFRG